MMAPLKDKVIYCNLFGTQVLIDFWLTVKALTLIFISGHGSAISSAIQGSFYNLVKSLSFFGSANMRSFHENPDCIYTDLTCINP